MVHRARQSLVAALLATAACQFDADYGGAQVTCSAAAPACPDGFTCTADRCQPTVAPPLDGAGPDASVCALAAQAADNDTCGAALAITVGATALDLYGDTTGYAADLAPSTLPGCTGSVEPGPDAVYRLALTAGTTLHAELAPLGFDGALYLLDGCSLTAACRGGADALGTGAVDTATIPITATGTYYLIVDASTASASGCYTLRLSL